MHSARTAAVAGVSVGPAALVLLRVNAAADLVAGSDTSGIGDDHHGEGDQQENEGSLEHGHVLFLLYRSQTIRKR